MIDNAQSSAASEVGLCTEAMVGIFGQPLSCDLPHGHAGQHHDENGASWYLAPEVREDTFGTYTEVWECEPPPVGVPYRVLDQEWSDDYTVRTIRRVYLLTASAQPDEGDAPSSACRAS